MTPSVEERLDRIERRNAALEAQSRGWKRACFVASAVAAVGLTIGQAGARDKDGDRIKARSVEAEEINLVDSKGNVRIEIGIDKHGAGMDIRDTRNKVRVAIGEGTMEGRGDGAGVWVFDEKERPRVGLGLGSKGGAGLIVLDEDGKAVAGEGKR